MVGVCEAAGAAATAAAAAAAAAAAVAAVVAAVVAAGVAAAAVAAAADAVAVVDEDGLLFEKELEVAGFAAATGNDRGSVAGRRGGTLRGAAGWAAVVDALFLPLAEGGRAMGAMGATFAGAGAGAGAACGRRARRVVATTSDAAARRRVGAATLDTGARAMGGAGAAGTVGAGVVGGGGGGGGSVACAAAGAAVDAGAEASACPPCPAAVPTACRRRGVRRLVAPPAVPATVCVALVCAGDRAAAAVPVVPMVPVVPAATGFGAADGGCVDGVAAWGYTATGAGKHTHNNNNSKVLRTRCDAEHGARSQTWPCSHTKPWQKPRIPESTPLSTAPKRIHTTSPDKQPEASP